MRHFLFLLLHGGLASSERTENYRFYTPYELDQQPTIAINDVYETSISSFDRTARLDCLQYQNQNGFASRNITDERLIWQETRLFKVKWFRLINSTDSVEITSSNSAETFSVDASDHLIIQSKQLDNVKTWLYCTWEYIGHSMQSVSDSRSHDPSYRGWYDTRSPSWKNEELVDFNRYQGKFKKGRQPIIWRSVPILFKAKVLPNHPEIACYNDMHIVHNDPIELSLDNCPRSGNQLKIIYDTPFALDCLASQGHFDDEDIKWFYENEPITMSKSSYGAMLNVQTMINGQLLDMNGVHLVQGQLHFNQAKGAFDGLYHCQIGPYQKSPPIQLSIINLQDLPPNTKERDVFDGRCFYPDAERSEFEISIETNDDGESLKIVTLERQRSSKIGNDVVFPRLCYKIAESYRKKLISDELNNERESFKKYMWPPLRPGIKNHTHFYESRSPAPFLSNDLLHSSVHRVDDLNTFSWEPHDDYTIKGEVIYTRPKFRFVSNGVNYDITNPNEYITFAMEPVIFSQFRTTAEMKKFETYEADTNIGISKRRQFFMSGKGKYWNRNAIYDNIEENVTVTCHIVGMGFSDSDLVWLHNGEKINPRAYKHSVRSARKINSYSTIHDVEQSKNVYCESLEDDEKKKMCREEQLLISFIPSVMPAIPDWDTTIEMDLFKSFFDPIDKTQRFYWRMDIELTPDQARGTFQCQAGNRRTGFKSATTIFFDRSDYKYTPAALSMQGQSMNDATNAQEWLSGNVIGDPFTFECRIDGLYREEIARFQWDSDQTSSHGDMSERQYHFPEPLLLRNGEEVKMNYAGLFAHRTDSGNKPSRHRIEIPWESGDVEVDDPLVPASMYNNFAFRPIVCDRYQIKYAMSYGHMTPAEMGTYSCSFDYATSSYLLNAFDREPVYKIKFVSVDIIPDKDGQDNRRGILIKWNVPLVDPCWSPLINDPGLTDEERDNYENGNNADRGGLSKEEYLIELRENCRRRSINCRVKDEKCISLDNLRVHFYLAIIPYLSVSYRTIEISGLNKRRLTNYSKEDILDLLVTNETDCEHGVACHVERGFHKSRCETITDELAKQECNLFVANGMMKYTCGCASFYDIVHEDNKPSIKTRSGVEIALEPSKPESNQRKLARSTKYIVKIHAEKLMTETNDNHQRIEQIIHSTEPATFVTPTLDLNALRAPEIERVLPIADYSTFYLRESLIASSMTKRKMRASLCWHKTNELIKARDVDEPEGVLTKNAVHAYRCHDFDIAKREIRIGPFEESTKFMAYVEVTVDEGEIITDKSLIKQFETDDYIRNPNSPLGLESFSMIPSSGGMSYRWEEPYAEANQYIRMTTWNGTEQVVYRFNPGEATVTKKCDEPRKSRHRNAITRRCYNKFKYTKPTVIDIPVSNRTSIRSFVEMFDFRNIQSNIKHAVFLANTTTRNELEQTVLPPCSMIGGEWESSNKVRLEWNCPPVSLSLPHGEKSYKTRSKENSIAELLAGLPKAKDNLYFHIRWTTDLWSQNDTGWFIPYNKVVNHDGSYKYNVTQDNTNTLSPTKTFEKILNECQVLNFQVRLIFFPTSSDRLHGKCLVSVGDSYGSIHKTRRLIDGHAGDVNCREYAGSPFSDTLSLQITPQDTLLPPEYEYSYIKNDRITLTTVKKLSHDCRQHYIQVQIRVKDKNRVENDQPVEQQQQQEPDSRQKKNESDDKETYKFPPDVYHSCYTLTSNKEATFRFDQFTRGEEKGSTSFNNLPLDSSSVYEIAIRRGRGQNNIETDMNTCSNYKEGQHSQWTEWIEMPMPLSKSTTTSTNVTPTQSSTSEPSTAARDECWLHKKFQYSCDVTDILLVVVAVLVLLLLLMFIYILYKSNCWCQTHDHDCNGNLPILNNTPKYIKTEFTQRPPNNDHNNRYEESAGLLLQRTTHEDANNEHSNSTLELNKGPSMTDLDVRSVPIRRSIQHRQPNLIQPTPQMISKQLNYQQYEENVQKSLPKDTNQTCGSLESPLIPPHLPEKQTNLEEKSEETDSFPSSNSSLYCDPKEKLIHSQTTILAPSQVLAALETTT